MKLLRGDVVDVSISCSSVGVSVSATGSSMRGAAAPASASNDGDRYAQAAHQYGPTATSHTGASLDGEDGCEEDPEAQVLTLPPLAQQGCTTSADVLLPGGRSARHDGDSSSWSARGMLVARTAFGNRRSRKPAVVTFALGPLKCTLDGNTYMALRQSSKLAASVLPSIRHGKPPPTPVAMLSIPHYSDAANVWVLRCTERWLLTGALDGFSAVQAAKLWVAADFLQIDGLQQACEDTLISHAAAECNAMHTAQEQQQETQQQQQESQEQQQEWMQQQQQQQEQQRRGSNVALELALELCIRHRNSCSRLQRLIAAAALRHCAELPLNAAAAWLAPLLAAHQPLLLPALHDELRDRLVAACTLNHSMDSDAPCEHVG